MWLPSPADQDRIISERGAGERRVLGIIARQAFSAEDDIMKNMIILT